MVADQNNVDILTVLGSHREERALLDAGAAVLLEVKKNTLPGLL